jgi:hypothetical protein
MTRAMARLAIAVKHGSADGRISGEPPPVVWEDPSHCQAKRPTGMWAVFS